MLGALGRFFYFLSIVIIGGTLVQLTFRGDNWLVSNLDLPWLGTFLEAVTPKETITYDPETFRTGAVGEAQSSGTSPYVSKYEDKKRSFEPLTTFDETFAWRRAARSVGSLQIQWSDKDGAWGEVTRCTASIVSDPKYAPTTLLTAQHCLEPNPDEGLYGPYRLAFVLGYLGADNERDDDWIIVPAETVSGNITDGTTEKLDYALLQANFGDINKYEEFRRPQALRLAHSDLTRDHRLYMVHHPMDYRLLLTSYDCRSKNDALLSQQKSFYHSCDTLPGSSGAPIFALPGDYAVGIHYNGDYDLYSDDNVNNRAQFIGAIAADNDRVANLLQPKPFLLTELRRLRKHYEWASSRQVYTEQNYALAAQIIYAGFPKDARNRKDLPADDDSTKSQNILIESLLRNKERHRMRHTDNVSHAAFSPDGARIVTASWDGTARLWSAETGTLLHSLVGHTEGVRHAAFSPDGARIVTASWDDTARLWSAATGTLLHTLEGHAADISHAAFSPDGARIVTASWDARLWSAETGALLHTLEGHTEGVSHAAFSPDGARIVTASWDGTARLWSAETGTLLHALVGHTEGVSHAAFSPDGARIVTASWDGTARLWSAETGTLLHALVGHTIAVSGAVFSPDGARIVTTSLNGSTRLWSVETGALLHTLVGHTAGRANAAFSPDGARIVTASRDARLWSAETGALLHTLVGHTGGVSHAAFSPDGARIVTASRDGTARLWSVETEALLHTLEGHTKPVSLAAFSPDGAPHRHRLTGRAPLVR